MTHNELRKDYLIDRWVVIAAGRGRRPTDFVRTEKAKVQAEICPLCPGNEHMTPPAVLLYLEKDGEITRSRDENDFRHKGWKIRCVPNLYPAFTQPTKGFKQRRFKSFNLAVAVGHHEVLVESPVHGEHPSDAGIQQLVHVVKAYADRLSELSSRPYVRHVAIFRNHGLEAGASLSHAHSQIVAMPFVPKIVKEEMQASRRYWREKGECAFCSLIRMERESPRFIMENSHFVVFAPWASVHPMEFWILPKNHRSSLLGISDNEMRDFAKTLKACFSGLKSLLNDPPYNFGFHLALGKAANQHYHWHLEVYPKLVIWAGFEKSTGVYINTVSPETAADSLKTTISSQSV